MVAKKKIQGKHESITVSCTYILQKKNTLWFTIQPCKSVPRTYFPYSRFKSQTCKQASKKAKTDTRKKEKTVTSLQAQISISLN